MTDAIITLEILSRAHAKEMSKIASEEVECKLFENSDLYIFGSELACLRIMYANRHKETKVAYSDNLQTFFVAIYSGQ
jgi:hypothetical protein